jgi:hypothetical protein
MCMEIGRVFRREEIRLDAWVYAEPQRLLNATDPEDVILSAAKNLKLREMLRPSRRAGRPQHDRDYFVCHLSR